MLTDFILELVRTHTEPDQKALVVCHKQMFDNQNIPSWPKDDTRFNDGTLYTFEDGWELEGRTLGAVCHGRGIGENHWQDSGTVFLIGEHHIPTRENIAQAQGLKGPQGPRGRIRANEHAEHHHT